MPDAWPNVFRQSRFLSAVDFVQADRFRRKVAQEMARVFSEVDLLLVPSLRDEMLVITNFTGHPSLTLRAGFVEVSEARSDWAPDPKHPLPKFSPPRRVPHGVTLIGRLFEEGTLAQAGMALEEAFGVAGERPPGFQRFAGEEVFGPKGKGFNPRRGRGRRFIARRGGHQVFHGLQRAECRRARPWRCSSAPPPRRRNRVGAPGPSPAAGHR